MCFIEARWRHMVSAKWFVSDAGNALSSHQAIIWTNAALLSVGPCGAYFIFFFKSKSFLSKTASGDAVGNISAILCRP